MRSLKWDKISIFSEKSTVSNSAVKLNDFWQIFIAYTGAIQATHGRIFLLPCQLHKIHQQIFHQSRNPFSDAFTFNLFLKINFLCDEKPSRKRWKQKWISFLNFWWFSKFSLIRWKIPYSAHSLMRCENATHVFFSSHSGWKLCWIINNRMCYTDFYFLMIF